MTAASAPHSSPPAADVPRVEAPPSSTPSSTPGAPKLRPYQQAAIAAIERELDEAGRRSTLLTLPTGAGKCLGLGTPVLRFDGTIVAVEDVRAGDLLMGPDSQPRRVRSTTLGHGQLYRVTPARGAPWICNDVHVLTLVHTETGEIIDVDLPRYLAETKYFRHLHKQFTPEDGISFARSKRLPLDPYFLGVWYGDGTKRLNGVAISKPDPEIEACVRDIAEQFGLRVRTEVAASGCPTHHIVHGPGAHPNPLLSLLRSIVGEGTALPHAYLTASRADRLAVLAGLLDTDGYMARSGFEIAQKRRGFADGVCFLARSLGLRAILVAKIVNGTTYWRVTISGDCSVIPTRIPRKRAPVRQQIKCATRTGFTVTPLDVGDYAGFELDGDGRFLLGDFTVTHNTVVFAERTRRRKQHGDRTLILVNRIELVNQARRKLEDVGISADVEKGKQRASLNAKVVVASVQSLRGDRLKRFARDHFAQIVCDEAHHAVSPSHRAILDHFLEAKVLLVTATPDRADGVALGEICETVAYRYEMRDAIRDRYLVPIVARRIVVESVDLSTVKTRAGDLAQDELAAVMETERAIRGTVVPLLDVARDRKTVVYGVDVEHARLLAQGLNDLRPGCARYVSGETDDIERARTLAAFAAGEFQFLCNCALLVEGWDEPSVSCVVIAVPTKSRARFVQMAGRGARLLGSTWEESVAAGKRDMLLVVCGGVAGKHRLCGPVDCLAGSEQGMDAFADDLRAELDRVLGTQQRELESVLAAADAEVQRRRQALAIDALVTFHAEEIDPFVGDADHEAKLGVRTVVESGWSDRRPTEAQLRALDRAGVTVKHLPASFSMADASRLLGRLAARRARGLCSLAQARRIAQGTGIDTRALTFERAKELCTILRLGSWRPQALFATPEYIAAANARPHDTRRLSAEPPALAAATAPDHEALP